MLSVPSYEGLGREGGSMDQAHDWIMTVVSKSRMLPLIQRFGQGTFHLKGTDATALCGTAGLYHALVPASTVVIFKLTVRLTGNGLAFVHRNRLHLNLRSRSVSHGIWFSLQALTETCPQNRSFPARKNPRAPQPPERLLSRTSV